MEDYKNKPSDYFSHARLDMISFIPVNSNNRILEIGAAGGDTLLEIKRRNLAKEVMGVELMSVPNSNQNSPDIEKFIVGNVEQMELPFQEEYFDVVICGDVFEHLMDPWKLVEKISRLLKKGGVLITSIPNIRIKSALLKIYVKGDFRYTKDGIFDKTHIRFFCKKNMAELLTKSTDNMEIVNIKRNFDFTPNSKGNILNKLTFSLFEEFLALQFLFAVRKVK